VAVATGLVVAATVILGATDATFTTNSATGPNTFLASTVALVDDDGGNSPTTGTALFTANGLAIGGPAASRCLTVTYTGNVAAAVRMYTTSTSGTLGGYLNLTVEIGSGGGFAGCTGFAASGTLFSGTLATFITARTDYASGLSTGWTPGVNGATATFRITYAVPNDPAAIGRTAGATLVWEAQD
jgi:hypothetical protein